MHINTRYVHKFLITASIILIGFLVYQHFNRKETNDIQRVVLCIPVYGQSLALGEEAVRITDFDSLRIRNNGRIVTENLDHAFGYYDHSSILKQNIKRLLHYDKKAFELSVYGMAETLVRQLGVDTLICIFPGGHGMNTISDLMKPSEPYNKFISEVAHAYKKAKEKGWEFFVPAICWMQGESDIANYPDYDYKKVFRQMYHNLNTDIKHITQQKEDVRMICYQTNVVTKGERYMPNHYEGTEARTPEALMELVRDDTLVWASGPTYPYSFVRDVLHIDAIGQKRLGNLAARSVLGILRKEKRNTGVVPTEAIINGHDIRILVQVPHPPLCIDTNNVTKVANYGFNVIRNDNTDIISEVRLDRDTIVIKCKESPIGCKIRYAINGERNKSGWKIGPRGNLRDSQGDNDSISIQGKRYPQHHWCYQFEIMGKQKK